MMIYVENYLKTYVPSYFRLGIEFSWGHVEISFIKFGIVILWGKPKQYPDGGENDAYLDASD